jgi:hypothetical protein
MGITTISASDPEASLALELCEVTRYRDMLVGAAEVAHASDLPTYVPLTGQEPEIATESAAWVFAFRGDVPLGLLTRTRGPLVAHDPTCVVIGADHYWFMTGGATLADGSDTTPLPASPAETLPPLEP